MFRYLILCILLILVSCTKKSSPEHSPQITAKAEAFTTIKAKHSGKCVDLSGATKELLGRVQQWTCNGTNAQNFELIAKGAYLQIKNVNSGLCLDVKGAETANAVPVIQWTCHGGDSQLWSKEDKGSGYYYLKAKHSGKCMDVSDISYDDGPIIHQWDCVNGGNQIFALGATIVAPPPPTTTPPPPTSTTGIPEGRGASLPYVEYQAEDGQTNGTQLNGGRNKYDSNVIEAEAVGRRAVRLSGNGQFVAWKARNAFNSIVVRLSIPDAPGGGGIDASLGVYVNGTRVSSLAVTSRYSWNYNGEDIRTPNAPGAEPHVFFDEARLLLANYPQGTEIKLQRDGQDTAAFYVIDLIDLELVEPPSNNPGLRSVTDFGAIPNDGKDDSLAIQRAIDSTPSGGLFFPAGDFELNQKPDISLRGIQFRGAGMWHTRLRGRGANFYCWGSGGCKFSDFSIIGETKERNDATPDNAFSSHNGKDTVIERVWIEHVKVGYWNGSEQQGDFSDGFIFRNNRVRNTFADGINLTNGVRNALLENNHFRNTGDDAIALWSGKNAGKGPDSNNNVRHNTVQVPWRANCFAIYGGDNNRLTDNLCEDAVTYPGIHIGFEGWTAASDWPFTGITTVADNTVLRSGGRMFGKEFGGLRLNAGAGPVENLVIKGIQVFDSTYAGIEIDGNQEYRNVQLQNIQVKNSGGFGILIPQSPRGSLSFESISVSGSRQGTIKGPQNVINRLGGNTGF